MVAIHELSVQAAFFVFWSWSKLLENLRSAQRDGLRVEMRSPFLFVGDG
jgi:hypothetical protein